MKFIIYSASNFDDSLKAYLPKIKELGILEEYISVPDDDTYGTDIAIIKLDTLEELIKLTKTLHQDLILELNTFRREGTYGNVNEIPYELMIYDNFIE